MQDVSATWRRWSRSGGADNTWYPVTAVEIKTEDGAETLDRAVGKYITIQTGLLSSETLNLKALGECVSEVLTEVLSRYKGSTLCICGLGNRELVADSLGPDVISCRA